MIFSKIRENRNDAMSASCTNAEGKRVKYCVKCIGNKIITYWTERK